MLQDLRRAFAMLGDRKVRGVLWLGIGLSLATLVALFLGVEWVIAWASDTGHGWLDTLLQVLGAFGTAVVAWFLFPSIVVAVSSVFLERVVDATEEHHHPHLPPPLPVPLARSVASGLKLFGAGVLLNLLALPAYFVPLLNLPVWLALNGYLVGREYAEMVAARRLPADRAAVIWRDNRTVFWIAGAVVAVLLAVPVLNLVAPIVGAAFVTLRFQRYCGEATHVLREDV
jgi:CysZ protein